MSKSNSENETGCLIALFALAAMVIFPQLEAAVLYKAWEWHFSKLIPVSITYGQTVAFTMCVGMVFFRPRKEEIDPATVIHMLAQQLLVLVLAAIMIGVFA